MSRLKLKLLGQMECRSPSGELLSLPTRKAEALLAYLALASGIRHPRDRLVNLLWSDRGEDQARNSLRQSLSSLNKTLDGVLPGTLEVERTTISLNAEAVEIDVLEFSRLADQSDIGNLAKAADLYQGEFLEGMVIRDPACEQWLAEERDNLKRAYVEVLNSLSRLQLEQLDYSASIQSAERLVTTDPLEEMGWRILMTAYQQKGSRNHALKAYKRCCEVLRDELGVDPEAETRELQEQIKRGNLNQPVDIETPVKQKSELVKTDLGTSGGDHSIAVLPFDNLSGDPEQEYFSDGITESIILNLSLFPGLQVKSRNSSFAFKQQIKNLGEISEELNVDYVVEGSIRKSSEHIRITVQLIEAKSGNQIWGKRYDSELENIFDLEEELSRTIAATVTGRIESDLQRVALTKPAAHQQSYDLLLSGKYHCYKFTREDMVVAQEKLEACLVLDPTNVQAHALLYECHIVNWMERWVADYEHAFKLAGDYLHKALKLGPEVVMVQMFYAEYLIFCRDNETAARQIETALLLNPSDPGLLTIKAFNLNALGEYESALKLGKQSLQLDPYQPWADWMVAESQLYSGYPEDAIDTILNSKTAISYLKALLVVAYSQLGDQVRARQTMQQFLQMSRESMLSMPSSRDEWIKYWSDNLPYRDTKMTEELIGHLMKAGLCEEVEYQNSGSDVDRLPAIIVMPFENLSGDPDQEYFSDGITESIILNLSSFSGLKVKSRHSSFALKNSGKNLREIGDELEVQYIVEGSVRSSSGKIRITVQLVEAESGNQIWGKRYDAELDRLFELEEEFSQTIAGTIYGRIGKQVKLSKYQKPARNLKSYDYLMRGWYHAEKLNPADTTIAIEQFHKCIETDPKNADAHAVLAVEYLVLLFENWSDDRVKTLELVRQHIEKALEIDPENALAHSFMAEYCHYKRDFEQAMFHAEKSIELNPTLPDGYSMKGYVLATIRQYEEAVKLAERSIQIDPHHPYISWAAGEVFRCAGENKRAIKAFRSVPHTSPSMIGQISACLVDLGELDAARVEMKQYLELARQHMPNYPTSIEQWRQLWYEIAFYKFEEDFEALFSLLLKAGLCDHISETTDDLPSIAVLPFENMSGDPEQEYFSDGITISIILSLGLFKGLSVKSQNTSFAFKDSTKSSEVIAEELKVQYLVEGSIRKSGSKVRISVQLIESVSGNQVWGKQYDSELEDILELEQELSQTIAATISGRIGHGIQQSAARKPAKNLKSYDLLLRGLYSLGKFNADDLKIARKQLQNCIEIDPENSEAHTNLGMIHDIERYENWSTDRQISLNLSNHHYKKALEFGPDNALIHAYMVEHLFGIREYEQAEFHACRAIELNPTAAEGYSTKAGLFGFTRRYEEAIELADLCLQLDPHSVGAGWIAGEVYRVTGQYEKSIKAFRSISHPPTSVHAQIAACLIGLGLVDNAKSEMQLYEKLAREQMPNYPPSRDEWYLIWYEALPYKFQEDFEYFFDQLIQAGLCDDLSEATNN